tara:strand:+ start:69622 stop:69918 length:297 start_codon:yes stop_codon:yes gene_type:complete
VAVQIEVHELWTHANASPIVEAKWLLVLPQDWVVAFESNRVALALDGHGDAASEVTDHNVMATIAVDVVKDRRWVVALGAKELATDLDPHGRREVRVR